MDGKLSEEDIEALLAGFDLDDDEKESVGTDLSQDEISALLAGRDLASEYEKGSDKIDEKQAEDEKSTYFGEEGVEESASKEEDFEFEDINAGVNNEQESARTDEEQEIEDEKTGSDMPIDIFTRWEIDFGKQLGLKQMSEREEPIYNDLKIALDRVEDILDDLRDEINFGQEEPDERTTKSYTYYLSLQFMLQYKMYQLNPLGTVSRYVWEDEIGKLSIADIKENVRCYNEQQIYLQENEKNELLIEELNQKLKEPDLDVAEKEDIENQLSVCEHKRDLLQQGLEYFEEKITINLSQFTKPIVEPHEMIEKHTDYMKTLSQELKQNQDRQIELLALYRIGEIEEYPAEELQELKRNFFDLQREKRQARKYANVILKKEDRVEDFKEYDLKEANAEDIFDRMTKKERYKAKQTVLAIANRSKKLNFINKVTLRLSQSSINELIKKYIVTESIDLKRITGQSKEDWTVQIEAEKMAEQIYNDGVEREAEEQRDNGNSELPVEEGKEQGDNSEGVEKPAREADAGEHSDKGEASDDVLDDEKIAQIKAQLFADFEKLSTEDRVDIISRLYDIHEQGKEVLRMFDKLSPEVQRSFYNSITRDDREAHR